MEKLNQADAIVFGSLTYMGDVATRNTTVFGDRVNFQLEYKHSRKFTSDKG